MIQLLIWRWRLWCVERREHFKDRKFRAVMRDGWSADLGWRDFVDRISPFDRQSGYKRRRLRRLLYIVRFPRTSGAITWYGYAERFFRFVGPYTGPGRYEGNDHPDRLKAEWLDAQEADAIYGGGDYPLVERLFRNYPVPWSRKPESWILESDEMGFTQALFFENAIEASISYSGFEYRVDKYYEDRDPEEAWMDSQR